MKKLIYLLCISALSCTSNQNEESGTLGIRNISIKMSDVDDGISLLDYFDIDKIVPLETSSNILIKSVNGLIVENEGIYLLDYSEKILSKFDLKGNLLGKIDRFGKGPDEYLAINDFDLDQDTLILLDELSERYLFFDKNMSFIKTERTDFKHTSFLKVKNKKFIQYAANRLNDDLKSSNGKYYNLVINENGNFLKTYLPFLPSYGGRVYKGGTNQSYFTSDTAFFYFVHPTNNKIYKLNEDGIQEEIQIDFQDGQLNIDESNQEFDEFVSTLAKQKDVPRFVNNLTVRDRFMFFNFFCKDIMYNVIVNPQTNQSKIFKYGPDLKTKLQLNVLQYRGDYDGLICYMEFNEDTPHLTDQYNPHVKELLSKVTINDNPVLFFLKPKPTLK